MKTKRNKDVRCAEWREEMMTKGRFDEIEWKKQLTEVICFFRERQGAERLGV